MTVVSAFHVKLQSREHGCFLRLSLVTETQFSLQTMRQFPGSADILMKGCVDFFVL